MFINNSFCLLCSFTRGGDVVKKGQNFVDVNIECPHRYLILLVVFLTRPNLAELRSSSR